MFLAGLVTALAASTLAGPPALAASSPADPSARADRLTVDLLAQNGSGCPPGTVMVAASPDNTYFHVVHSMHYVEIGPNAAATDFRRSCQVTLSVHVPEGATYAIDRVDYGGYAYLAPGAIITQSARHHRTGQTVPPLQSHSWTGPYDDMWETVDTFPAEELYFPPCGTNPDFATLVNLRLDAGTSDPATETSFAATDSIDGPYGAVYHLQTKPC